MLTTGTKQLARGDKRVRALKCDYCGETGREIIDGAARSRPRRKKGSRLDPFQSATCKTTHKKNRPSGKIGNRSRHAEADGTIYTAKGQQIMFLLNVFHAGRKLDLPWNEFRGMSEDGLAPRPILVGDYVRWREQDLLDWVRDGCPAMAPMSAEEAEQFFDPLLAELKELDSKGISK
ncbi:MAG: hypothetical protein JXM70_23665 [Pirellulales bacterium]|nr:hypothetical protein [Pirellulales bacterium]